MSERIDTFSLKVRRALSQLPYLVRALDLVWDAARGWTALWLALLVVQGLLPAAAVYLTRALVNDLVATIGTGGDWATLAPTLILALLMAAIMLASQLLSSATVWVRTAQSELVADHVSSLVHRQSMRLDLAFYDSPDYYDRLHRARAEARYRPISLLESIGGLMQNGITLVAMAAVLLHYGLWLPTLLIISTMPALYVALRYRAREHRWRMDSTADERRTWYYDWLLTERESAAELRLFGLGQRFEDSYQAVRERLRSGRLRLDREEALARGTAGALGLLASGAGLAWMVVQAMRGLVTLGDLALFYQAFNQGQSLLRSILGNLSQVYSNSLFLGDLFEFLALEPQVMDPVAPEPFPSADAGAVNSVAQGSSSVGPSICFRSVSFRYPGDSRPILEDLSLQIGPGQTAAIVGPNGAGKSTLIKLLCRLYDPTSGEIELDGTDLRDLPIDVLRQHISVLFQEPVHFNASAAENIALGNGTERREAIVAAARAAGADGPIGRLRDGYDTLLGTWFDGGTDLSVGEWQRVALARAFLRRAPIVVLDEPTSAMDAWAEADWLARFRDVLRGCTTIMITHRFTTARHADIILVMDGGCIVEAGTHEQLLSRNGRYALGWQAQAATGAGQSSPWDAATTL